MNIPTNSIVVSNRQRTEKDIDDLFVASVAKRLIHPIVLRRNGSDEPTLVVGERRLLALKKAEINELIENVHFRFFDDLSPTEAQVIELEENIKRSDLSWRDHVSAIAGLDKIYCETNPDWNLRKTAQELNLNYDWTSKVLIVSKHLNSPALRDAGSIKQAISILENAASRRIASIIGEISNAGQNIFQTSTPESEKPFNENPSNTYNPLLLDTNNRVDNVPLDPILPIPPRPKAPQAVLNADFIEWTKTYSGPKFTFIHCDFPYDLDYKQYAESKTSTAEDYDGTGTSYWELLDTLCDNIEKLASYQSHVMFWFSMKHYDATKKRLAASSLFVHDHPLFWLKTDNAGIIPGNDGTYPRRIYETAFLCSRGKRPLVKPLANAYGAPTAANAIHPSQKPEPVLRHFLSMFVDETTDVLDPTCGSGSALRAAEDLGARSVLGLELNIKYVETAESMCQNARAMRRISR